LIIEGEETIEEDSDVSLFFQADKGFFVNFTGIDGDGKRCCFVAEVLDDVAGDKEVVVVTTTGIGGGEGRCFFFFRDGLCIAIASLTGLGDSCFTGKLNEKFVGRVVSITSSICSLVNSISAVPNFSTDFSRRLAVVGAKLTTGFTGRDEIVLSNDSRALGI
jgi:hypothetical protein